MAKGSALNDKQKRFVAEYLVDQNATQAAIRAGYSAKTAGAQAHKLLKIAEIAGAIAASQQRIADKLEITVERLTDMLIEDREGARKEGQYAAAISAVEKIAKLHGLMIDRKEVRQASKRSASDYTDDELLAILMAAGPQNVDMRAPNLRQALGGISGNDSKVRN